jgi:hypothetical protein
MKLESLIGFSTLSIWLRFCSINEIVANIYYNFLGFHLNCSLDRAHNSAEKLGLNGKLISCTEVTR